MQFGETGLKLELNTQNIGEGDTESNPKFSADHFTTKWCLTQMQKLSKVPVSPVLVNCGH